MTKKNALLVGESEERIHYVYADSQLAKLSELTNLRPGIYNRAKLATSEVSDVEILFSTWGMPCLSDEELARMPKLEAVFYSAGATDAFARPLFKRNIKVLSAWQANAIPVAEFCVAQILLALKGYFANTRTIRTQATWKSPDTYIGPGTYGETVALIGAGAISSHIQELLKVFKLNVIVVPSRAERRTISLEEAFQKAFVVSNHLPNRNDNIGVLNGKLFSSMRPGAVFINTGRGAQVNEKELIEVLEKRPDLTALLDVTHPEPPLPGSKLYTLPNVQLSSHIAGSVNDEVHRMSDYMLEELQRYLAGEPLKYQVFESMLLTSTK